MGAKIKRKKKRSIVYVLKDFVKNPDRVDNGIHVVYFVVFEAERER